MADKIRKFKELKLMQRGYKITEWLTTTAFSTLYFAFDSKTKEQLIVKECKCDDDFKREVAASTAIFSRGHNNYIVPIISNFPEERRLIMPYMKGGDLWDLRKNKKGLTPEQCFAIAAQVGLALQQVHAAGVIHNDIKSGNILLADAEYSSDRTPIAKLTDFGLSFRLSHGYSLEELYKAGTLAYMAPEKLSFSGPLTFAVDIYSLGLVVHEILTDTLLYESCVTTILPYDVIPSHERIPEKVLQVIRTACEINPANRYNSAAEMISDLEKAVYGR